MGTPEELEVERAAVAAVKADLATAARTVAGYPALWNWGDGHGGALVDMWLKALAAEGFVIPEPPEPEPNRRQPTKAEVALRVFRRDGYRCQHCGISENLTVDHIIPVVKGGPHEMDNFQTLCGPCNSRKGGR